MKHTLGVVLLLCCCTLALGGCAAKPLPFPLQPADLEEFLSAQELDLTIDEENLYLEEQKSLYNLDSPDGFQLGLSTHADGEARWLQLHLSLPVDYEDGQRETFLEDNLAEILYLAGLLFGDTQYTEQAARAYQIALANREEGKSVGLIAFQGNYDGFHCRIQANLLPTPVSTTTLHNLYIRILNDAAHEQEMAAAEAEA